jgi:hypothetical protein
MLDRRQEEEDDDYLIKEFREFKRLCNHDPHNDSIRCEYEDEEEGSMLDDAISCDSTISSRGQYYNGSKQRVTFTFDDASTTCPKSNEKGYANEFYGSKSLPRPTSRHQNKRSEGSKKPASFQILNEQRFDSRVLGTSCKDASASPHVLDVNIIDHIQEHLPYCKRGELLWLKYSLIRDGASMETMLNKTKRSQYTILAAETQEGEVFGAFVSAPWRLKSDFYGTPESFLWRLKRRRSAKNLQKSKNQLYSNELEVFRYAGHNSYIQFSNRNRIAVGGGSITSAPATIVDDPTSSSSSSSSSHSSSSNNPPFKKPTFTDWGFGLAFESNLQSGSSAPCVTFQSPSLSRKHSDGSSFEITNLEVWSLTPCLSVKDAERMEIGKMYMESCMTV